MFRVSLLVMALAAAAPDKGVLPIQEIIQAKEPWDASPVVAVTCRAAAGVERAASESLCAGLVSGLAASPALSAAFLLGDIPGDAGAVAAAGLTRGATLVVVATVDHAETRVVVLNTKGKQKALLTITSNGVPGERTSAQPAIRPPGPGPAESPTPPPPQGQQSVLTWTLNDSALAEALAVGEDELGEGRVSIVWARFPRKNAALVDAWAQLRVALIAKLKALDARSREPSDLGFVSGDADRETLYNLKLRGRPSGICLFVFLEEDQPAGTPKLTMHVMTALGSRTLTIKRRTVFGTSSQPADAGRLAAARMAIFEAEALTSNGGNILASDKRPLSARSLATQVEDRALDDGLNRVEDAKRANATASTVKNVGCCMCFCPGPLIGLIVYAVGSTMERDAGLKPADIRGAITKYNQKLAAELALDPAQLPSKHFPAKR